METSETLPVPVNGHALALAQEPAGLPMPVQTAQIVQRVEAVREIVNKVFKEGTHFGTIPGTGDKKTLLKPGFDTLCLAFQFSPEFIKQSESIERDDFINLVYKCKLIHSPTGRTIATGDGSCNSKEEKYRWTSLSRKCPACGKEAILKSKDRPEWFCWAKKGGCGAKFKEGDPAVEKQEVGRKENDNPWNFHNTLTKMAQKRSGMAAIITACGLSSDFTQDMEDFDAQPNPKYQDPGLVDIPPANAGIYPGEIPHGQREAYDPDKHGAPQEWRDELEGAAAQAEDASFRPAVPADIASAQEEVRILVKKCETAEDFRNLVAKMRSLGGVYKDPRVTAVLNDAYYSKYPKAA